MRVVQPGEQRFARAVFTPRHYASFACQRSLLDDTAMISARSTPSERALAEEVGATACLTKPIGRASFLETVSRLLRKPEDEQSVPPRILGTPANDANGIPGEEPPGWCKSMVRRDRREKR